MAERQQSRERGGGEGNGFALASARQPKPSTSCAPSSIRATSAIKDSAQVSEERAKTGPGTRPRRYKAAGPAQRSGDREDHRDRRAQTPWQAYCCLCAWFLHGEPDQALNCAMRRLARAPRLIGFEQGLFRWSECSDAADARIFPGKSPGAVWRQDSATCLAWALASLPRSRRLALITASGIGSSSAAGHRDRPAAPRISRLGCTARRRSCDRLRRDRPDQ